MARPGPLPFDPIDESARQWDQRWPGVSKLQAVTSLMRVQQLVLGELDDILRGYGLSFARYEALLLLSFSHQGALPLGKMGERLQVHPTSVTSIVERLAASGHVVRRRHPTDGRTVLAEITDSGRALIEEASQELLAVDFGLGSLDPTQLAALTALLRPVRLAAGDFVEPPATAIPTQSRGIVGWSHHRHGRPAAHHESAGGGLR